MGVEEQKSAKIIIFDETEKWNNLRTMKNNAEIRAQEIIAKARAHPELVKEGMVAIELSENEWGWIEENTPWKGLRFLQSYENQVVVNRLFEAGFKLKIKIHPHINGTFAVKIYR